MKNEKPVKTVKYPAKKGARRHSYETRIFAREIHEIFCTDKRCEFFGQHAVQGVCYSNKPDLIDWERVEKQSQHQVEELAYFRKKYHRGDLKGYVKWLEAMYTCAMTNWQFGLDEMIRLRRDNAILKHRAKNK